MTERQSSRTSGRLRVGFVGPILLILVLLSGPISAMAGPVQAGAVKADHAVPPAPTHTLSQEEECLLQALKTAGDGLTVGELKRRCSLAAQKDRKEDNKPTKQVDERLTVDKANTLKPFTLMAHKPTYILVGAYNFSGVNQEPFQTEYRDRDTQFYYWETKFQLSIKVPLLVGLFKDQVDIYGAYTNRSFWQVYKTESSPFRETNHEPEMWAQFKTNWLIWGLTVRMVSLGLAHQSNGRGGSLSRSWNRVVGSVVFERENLVIGLIPWLRIPERESQDDNPDIVDYLGWGQVRLAYKWQDHTFSLMARNVLESGFKRGAVEFSWSFPLGGYKFLKGYLHYFSGYGESLIDYNHYSHSIGLGICLTDWL